MPDNPHPTALVVFAATDKQLSRVDVALGPCMPAPGQRKALKNPLEQDGGESPEQASALFTVLTNQPPVSALRLVESAGEGRLYVCSGAFVDAMADAAEALLATSDDAGFAAAQDRISTAWMTAVEWPAHYVGLQNRLHRLGLARQARTRRLPLYFWFGPKIPMRSVVTGSGPYLQN